MDGGRFDRIAREMVTGRSRRSIVKGLAAVGLGALGLGGGSAAAAPRCKGTGTRCTKGDQCCSLSCAAPPTGGASRASICCPAGQVQSPGGVCCAPTTCAAQGKTCGTIPDGCGGTLACGTCAGFQTCGGGGTPGVCGCTPDCTGKTCGADDGCGGTCLAGPCPTFQTCHGGACVDPCSLGTCAGCGTDYCAALPGGDAICVIDAGTLCGTECVSDSDCLVHSPFTTCLSSPSICGKATGSCSLVSSDRTCG